MNGMRRCWILVSIFLLSSFVGFSSFNFNSELGTEIMEFGDSKDEPFTLYNEWWWKDPSTGNWSRWN